jgi:hypothetical protein
MEERMMRPSRTIRRGTILSFAIAVGALFVSAVPAFAAQQPKEFDDPNDSGNFLYLSHPDGPDASGFIEFGLCLAADQGPLKKGYYFLHVASTPGGGPAPGSDPGPCPTDGIPQKGPVQNTEDGGLAVVDPTNQLISENAANPGFLYANPPSATKQSVELGMCLAGGPLTDPGPLTTGWYFLQLAPPPGGGGGFPGAQSPGTDTTGDPCPELPGDGPPPGPDGDGDTIPDADDNCVTVQNTDQADWNNDDQGDVCDDSDVDGVMDATDACRTQAGPSSNGGCPATAAPPPSGGTAPNTKASGPKSTTSPRPTFKLNSNTPGAKFECRIDKKGKFKPCKKTFRPSKKLKPGKHLLEARAIANGQRDKTPAKVPFTVKRKRA